LKLFLKEIDEKWRTKLFHLLVGTPIIGWDQIIFTKSFLFKIKHDFHFQYRMADSYLKWFCLCFHSQEYLSQHLILQSINSNFLLIFNSTNGR
jgi:hypothetical protein